MFEVLPGLIVDVIIVFHAKSYFLTGIFFHAHHRLCWFSQRSYGNIWRNFLEYCWRLQNCSFVVSHAVVGNDVHCYYYLLWNE